MTSSQIVVQKDQWNTNRECSNASTENPNDTTTVIVCLRAVHRSLGKCLHLCFSRVVLIKVKVFMNVYSKDWNKRTVWNKRTGGKILKK